MCECIKHNGNHHGMIYMLNVAHPLPCRHNRIVKDVIDSIHFGIDGSKAERESNGGEPWSELRGMAEQEKCVGLSLHVTLA